ncbi:hypothetical protein ACTD5D_32185 [Nocardia takedensis]|uniref:hypothetical protein n=1 Tax=Nocardia takedensis TaxID=259390 RepID=UPI003F75F47A
MKLHGTAAQAPSPARPGLLNGPAPCAVCDRGLVYGVRAFCAWCFRAMRPDLQDEVRAVGDLPRDDPRKQQVIARCRKARP